MRKKPYIVVCDNIRSTHNVGSIFRTADGAGFSHIYLCGITPRPPRPDIAKVSLGAEKNIPFTYRRSTRETVRTLKKAGYQIIALENNVPGSLEYGHATFRPPLALIVGSEVGGIDSKVLRLAHQKVSIPMRGAKESLNVSVAFGIIAYAITS